MELTREFLNADCDTDWVRAIVPRIVNTIKMNILNTYKTQQKIVWDIGVERDTINYCNELLQRLNYGRRQPQTNDYKELSFKFALEMVVAELKKIFVDSSVFYQNKEIFDIHDKMTIHRLIIVDWELKE